MLYIIKYFKWDCICLPQPMLKEWTLEIRVLTNRLYCLALRIAQQFFFFFCEIYASLVAQRLKRLPPMRETQVRSLGGEDPLEKEMAAHSSILAWRIPWTEEPGGLQSTASQRVGHNWVTLLTYLLNSSYWLFFMHSVSLHSHLWDGLSLTWCWNKIIILICQHANKNILCCNFSLFNLPVICVQQI